MKQVVSFFFPLGYRSFGSVTFSLRKFITSFKTHLMLKMKYCSNSQSSNICNQNNLHLIPKLLEENNDLTCTEYEQVVTIYINKIRS